MNSNTTNKSTREIRNQILSDIQKVKEDFAELRQRMTPGQLIDDAIFYRRGDTTPSMTFDHLRRNPVGTTFLTLGTLLLMEDDSHVSYEGMVRNRAGDIKARVGGAVGQARGTINTIKSKFPHKDASSDMQGSMNVDMIRSKVDDARSTIGSASDSVMSSTREGIQDAKSSISSMASDARDTLSSAATDAKSSLHSAADTVRSKTSAGIDTAKSSLNHAADVIKSRSQEAYHTAKNLDPLTYLALGAGLGTLTGAAFPVSETEIQAVDQNLEDKMVNFRKEVEQALNQSVNILKNEFIGGLTDINMSFF